MLLTRSNFNLNYSSVFIILAMDISKLANFVKNIDEETNA